MRARSPRPPIVPAPARTHTHDGWVTELTPSLFVRGFSLRYLKTSSTYHQHNPSYTRARVNTYGACARPRARAHAPRFAPTHDRRPLPLGPVAGGARALHPPHAAPGVHVDTEAASVRCAGGRYASLSPIASASVRPAPIRDTHARVFGISRAIANAGDPAPPGRHREFWPCLQIGRTKADPRRSRSGRPGSARCSTGSRLADHPERPDPDVVRPGPAAAAEAHRPGPGPRAAKHPAIRGGPGRVSSRHARPRVDHSPGSGPGARTR